MDLPTERLVAQPGEQQRWEIDPTKARAIERQQGIVQALASQIADTDSILADLMMIQAGSALVVPGSLWVMRKGFYMTDPRKSFAPASVANLTVRRMCNPITAAGAVMFGMTVSSFATDWRKLIVALSVRQDLYARKYEAEDERQKLMADIGVGKRPPVDVSAAVKN